MPKRHHQKTDPIVRRPAPATPPPADAAAARSRAARLAVVRIALLAGVLACGGAVWIARRNGGGPATVDFAAPAGIRTLGSVVWLAALVGLVLFWFLIPRARDEARRSSYTIFAWAAAEMPALFGAAYYYLTGDSRWYIYGVTLLVGSLLVVPGKR